MDKDILSQEPFTKITAKSTSNSTIRYVTFNVNGVKTIFNYHPWNKFNQDYNALFNLLHADIITLQELKLSESTIQQAKNIAHLKDFKSFISLPATKKGYSGVGLFIRNPPEGKNAKHLTVIKAEEGITGWLCSRNGEKVPYRELNDNIGGYTDFDLQLGQFLDSEGRCVVVELADNTVIFAVYCPANSQRTYEGELFRLTFMKLLLERCRNLQAMGKKVVVMGDININLDLIDNAEGIELGIKDNSVRMAVTGHRFESINYEECVKFKSSLDARILLNKYVYRTMWQDLTTDGKEQNKDDEGKQFLYDTTRYVQGRRMKMYTVWNTLTNSREVNYGSRIDLILFSDETMVRNVSQADIWPCILGSDHCPVFTDCDVVTSNDDEDEDNVLEVPGKLNFEAKYHFKLDKTRDITSLFGSKKPKKAIGKDTSSSSSESTTPKPETSSQESSQKSKYVYKSRKVEKPEKKKPSKNKSISNYFK
ncbi:DNA-(apurinic or apyrimidinic site) lyase 2 [Candida viswanathii]|uniref:DNA-(Apurinic or apyrimidinic site) lyase 2 n=1 Tax=Candida viswanathii TaxID=5486 RepID=A0A367YCJ3_9ASCO|nr:DNA-(apurinic or apyrimidinic site) lyase 2 [Candida viswanathii]